MIFLCITSFIYSLYSLYTVFYLFLVIKSLIFFYDYLTKLSDYSHIRYHDNRFTQYSYLESYLHIFDDKQPKEYTSAHFGHKYYKEQKITYWTLLFALTSAGLTAYYHRSQSTQKYKLTYILCSPIDMTLYITKAMIRKYIINKTFDVIQKAVT